MFGTGASMTKDTRGDNIIDSRDVIERYEELSAEREELEEQVQEMDDGDIEGGKEAIAELAAWLEENGDEFNALTDLCEDGEGFSDWKHGMTLIKDSYFVTYAKELAYDIGYISVPVDWPYTYIDWDNAAEALQSDYTSVDFADKTYWGR